MNPFLHWTLTNPLALLLFPVLWLLVWRVGWQTLGAVWRQRLALGLRTVLLALLVLALANPTQVVRTLETQAAVYIVDQSASLGANGQALLRGWAEEIQGRGSHSLRTILFAEQALVLPPGLSPLSLAPEGGAPEGAQTESRLAHALSLASQMVPDGGRLVVLSDGNATDEAALETVSAALVQQKIPVDVWVFPTETRLDVGLTQLDVPPVVRRGESYVVTLRAVATQATPARLQLWQGSRLLVEQSLALAQGENEFTFDDQVSREMALGVAGFRAQLVVEGDEQPQNDNLAAATTVAPSAKLLLVATDIARIYNLYVSLVNEGFEVSTAIPDLLSDDPDTLAQNADAIWMLDVSAESLSLGQMSALQSYVRDLGHGLLVSGGRQSFELGNYANTPLEASLPVRAEPRPRAQRRGVSMLLIIDRSASMEVLETYSPSGALGPTKLEMAKQAAILAVENLGPDDRVGVLQFDNEVSWVVPFRQVGAGLERDGIRQAISMIRGGGGTDIPPALDEGLRELALQPPGARHAILLTDGRSSSGSQEDYRRLINRARESGITLSTIAIGFTADQELLQVLADWGQGRYAFAATPEELPALTIRESQLLRTESVQEGDFFAELSNPHPTLQGFRPGDLPMLEGYVATTPRPQAEMVLISPEKDPILAAWQYGLGRSVAWMPDVGGPWTREWQGWPEANRFWGTLVRYVLPDPLIGPLALRVEREGNVATIEANALEPDGVPINKAGSPGGPILSTTIAALGPTSAETPQPLRLRQVAPGRYRATVRLPEAGLYQISARLEWRGAPLEATTTVVQPYAPEYRPMLGGVARLEALADQTGGQVLSAPLATLPPPSQGTPPPRRVAPWLLALALLLWPLDIAFRRGWLG